MSTTRPISIKWVSALDEYEKNIEFREIASSANVFFFRKQSLVWMELDADDDDEENNKKMK